MPKTNDSVFSTVAMRMRLVCTRLCAEVTFFIGSSLLLLHVFTNEPAPGIILVSAIIMLVIGGLFYVLHRSHLSHFMVSLKHILNDALHGKEINFLQPVTGMKSSADVAEDIHKVMSSLKSNNDIVSDVSTNMEVHANDLSQQTIFVADKILEQTSKTDLTHNAVKELAGVFSAALTTAKKTVEVAGRSEREGENGKLVMTKAMSNVCALSDSVVATGGMIKNLTNESKEIGGIINVIKGVAEQTNLLALNAAIEAARAGEQGRGFAVVADEVRSLAGKTQQYASEIEMIIDGLINKISTVADKVDEAVEMATESDELIEDVVVSYSEIIGHTIEVSALGKELAKITQHEKRASDVVFDMFAEIKSISDSTNGSLQLMQESSAELCGLGRQLSVVTETAS